MSRDLASNGNLGEEVTAQLLTFPKMLYITGGTILFLGLFTPINDIINDSNCRFIIYLEDIDSLIFLKQVKNRLQDMEEQKVSDEMKSPESVVNLLSMDPIEFEFGYGLIPLVDTNQGGDLLDRIVMIRRQLAIELGMVIPVVRIRDNIQLTTK